MKGHLLMSRKELKRKAVLDLVVSGELGLVEASRRMRLSYRQTLRVFQRFVAQGDAGLLHRGRGEASNRGYPRSFRDRVVRRYRERYEEYDVGPTLAAEKLAQEGFVLDHETLRRWLLEEGVWTKRRQRQRHRSRRGRRARFGELVQMDGSHHPWFGPEQGRSCLMNMVDDATGTTAGLLAEEETTEAAMTLLRHWIERYGIPMALYTDRKNVYLTDREPTFEEQLAGEEPVTAFGKACQKLGIEIVAAHSPQAKGRVERSNGVYQDRFVKELGLSGIASLAAANRLLANGFVDTLNAKFSIAPLEAQDSHRPLPKDLDLDEVFCFETTRVVQNDWTVRHENRYYQILRENKPLPKPKARILVRTRLDGRTELLYRARPLAFRAISPQQLQQRRQQRTHPAPPTAKATKTASAPHKRWRPNVGRLAIMKVRDP